MNLRLQKFLNFLIELFNRKDKIEKTEDEHENMFNNEVIVSDRKL